MLKINILSFFFKISLFLSSLLTIGLFAEPIPGNQKDKQPVLPTRPVEDPIRRAALPLFKTEPAANPSELSDAIPIDQKQFKNWHRAYGDNHSSRYSNLKQVTPENIDRLKPVWTYHSKDGKERVVCNPVVAKDKVFFSTPGGFLVAVDGKSGKEIWRFRPEGLPETRKAMSFARRGCVYVSLPEGDRIYARSAERLYCINVENGELLTSFGENGSVKLRSSTHYTTPAIYRDSIIVAANNVESFDLISGKKRWEFNTRPQESELGYDTWLGQNGLPTKAGAGANCWGGFAIDDQRGLVFVTTGSPKPNLNGIDWTGRNLFANCIVAIDANKGTYRWHFQDLRHDIWDMDIPAAPNLVTISRNGKKIDAVSAITKTGITILVDRESGKPIFPFRLRRAPVSKIPGERTWPYQPDPELPEPFGQMHFTQKDLNPLSSSKAFVEQILARSNTEWMAPPDLEKGIIVNIYGGGEWPGASFDPETGYLYITSNRVPSIITMIKAKSLPKHIKEPNTKGRQLFLQFCSSCHGSNRLASHGVAPPLLGLEYRRTKQQVLELWKTGRNGMPPFPFFTKDQENHLLAYLFSEDLPSDLKKMIEKSEPRIFLNGYTLLNDQEGYPAFKPPWGEIICQDLNTGKIVWRTPFGNVEAMQQPGGPKTGRFNLGGCSVTAGGIVFATGTWDSKVYAFDSKSGKEIWNHDLPFISNAPPTIAEIDGRQMLIVVATGSRGGLGYVPGDNKSGMSGDAYVAFALDR